MMDPCPVIREEAFESSSSHDFGMGLSAVRLDDPRLRRLLLGRRRSELDDEPPVSDLEGVD